MMDWFVFSLLAGFLFALSRTVSRIFLKEQGDALAFTTIHDLIAGIILVPFLLVGVSFPTASITWLFLLGVIVSAFLTDWTAFLSLKRIGVSLYQIVGQTRHLFVLLGGFFLFAEQITGLKVFAILLIILGVIVALYERSKFHWSQGVYITILSAFLSVVLFIFAKLTIADFSEIAVITLEFIGVGFIGFGALGFKTEKLKQEWNINKKGLIASGIIFGFFELSLFVALKLGEISRVVPVLQSSLIFAVLMGILFLKERERILQKIVGMFIILIGIVLMYVI